jgi:hypothetical protein
MYVRLTLSLGSVLQPAPRHAQAACVDFDVTARPLSVAAAPVPVSPEGSTAAGATASAGGPGAIGVRASTKAGTGSSSSSSSQALLGGSVTRVRSLPLGLAGVERPAAERDAFASFFDGARCDMARPRGVDPATKAATTSELAAARAVKTDVDRRAAEISELISRAIASSPIIHGSDDTDSPSSGRSAEPGAERTPLLVAHSGTPKRRASALRPQATPDDEAAAAVQLDEAIGTVRRASV